VRADEDLRTSFDKIVEDIRSYLNNFIELRKKPSRQYRLETTTVSKLEGERNFKKIHLGLMGLLLIEWVKNGLFLKRRSFLDAFLTKSSFSSGRSNHVSPFESAGGLEWLNPPNRQKEVFKEKKLKSSIGQILLG